MGRFPHVEIELQLAIAESSEQLSKEKSGILPHTMALRCQGKHLVMLTARAS